MNRYTRYALRASVGFIIIHRKGNRVPSRLFSPPPLSSPPRSSSSLRALSLSFLGIHPHINTRTGPFSLPFYLSVSLSLLSSSFLVVVASRSLRPLVILIKPSGKKLVTPFLIVLPSLPSLLLLRSFPAVFPFLKRESL